MSNINKQIKMYIFKDNKKPKCMSVEGYLDYKLGCGYDTFEKISTNVYLTSVIAFNLY